MADRHGWNSWEQYQDSHYGHIQEFMQRNFILQDEVNPTLTSTQVKWEGWLYCEGNIEIIVDKILEVDIRHGGRIWVRTTKYAYHVMRRVGDHIINLFRYDNVHQHRDHQDRHHRHEFDTLGNERRITHVGVDGWPLLSDVIEEAYVWWTEHNDIP